MEIRYLAITSARIYPEIRINVFPNVVLLVKKNSARVEDRGEEIFKSEFKRGEIREEISIV